MFRILYEEDSMFGDITSDNIIPENMQAVGKIIAKEDGILAGSSYITKNLKKLGIEAKGMRDGTPFDINDVVIEVRGNAREILRAERTILNILGRMSGIATKTRKIVNEVKKINPNVRIACTRKTLWGYLDKIAVKIGGGDTHRWNLGDMVMIKDNHLALVSMEDAMNKLKDLSFTKKIEIEVESEEDAIKAARLGADIIMLDNMEPKEVCRIAKGLKEKYDVLVEVSGGITEKNVKDYAKCNVDVISMGSLTHSARSLNFSMELVKLENL